MHSRQRNQTDSEFLPRASPSLPCRQIADPLCLSSIRQWKKEKLKRRLKASLQPRFAAKLRRTSDCCRQLLQSNCQSKLKAWLNSGRLLKMLNSVALHSAGSTEWLTVQ